MIKSERKGRIILKESVSPLAQTSSPRDSTLSEQIKGLTNHRTTSELILNLISSLLPAFPQLYLMDDINSLFAKLEGKLKPKQQKKK